MLRSAIMFVVLAVCLLGLAGAGDSGASDTVVAPKPVMGKTPILVPFNPRSQNSRLFVGPFGNMASIVSSLGSVGVLGGFLLFLVFLPYIVSLFVVPLLTGTGGRSMSDSTSYVPYKHRLLDTLTLLDDLWRKFDANNPECRKAVLCQLMKEEDNLGVVGNRMKKLISLLPFFDSLDLPAPLNTYISPFSEAVRKGGQHNCPYQCPFSLAETLQKMNETGARSNSASRAGNDDAKRKDKPF